MIYIIALVLASVALYFSLREQDRRNKQYAKEQSIAYLNWYENDIDRSELPPLDEISDDDLYQGFLDQTNQQS